MRRLAPALFLGIFTLACGSSSKPKVPPPPPPETDPGTNVPPPPPPTPDAAAPRDTAAVPVDTAVSSDSATAPDSATSTPDGPPAIGDASGGGTVTEAMWSYTGCNQATLMFPNIDKNMGRFPPGSCPPPETLARPCGGNSKIKVMTATASAYETGYVHPPAYAVDEYLMTRWSSPSGPTAWLAMDLGSEQSFKRIYLAWELAHGTDYDIVVSNDGTTWQPLKQVRGGDGFQDIVDVEGKARHIRINGVTRGKTPTLYGYSLFDVVICAERP